MVDIGDGVDMEPFEKFAGFIEETSGMPQEEVRGVDGGVGIATLRGGNDVMAVILLMQKVRTSQTLPQRKVQKKAHESR